MAWPWKAPPTILPAAVEQVFYDLPEMGGANVNYPTVDWTVGRGLTLEIITGWFRGLDEVDSVGDARSEKADWLYVGNVYTIQLTMRPGYWVDPVEQTVLGWENGIVP